MQTNGNNNNNGGHDDAVRESMYTQSNSDQFFLDPKDIYEQREKMMEKEAREGTVSRKPGAHSSAETGNGSQITASHSSSRKPPPAHAVSPSTPVPNKNPKQQSQHDPRISESSNGGDDDEFTGYVNPQEIHDQREKLAAQEGRGKLGATHVGAVPSSASASASASAKTDSKATITGNSSHSKGGSKKKSKHKSKDASKHKHKSKKRKGDSSSSRQEHARDQETTVHASPVVPVGNDDPVLIATATKIESGRRNHPSKCWLICVVLAVLALGGGIGAAVVLLGGKSSSPSSDAPPVNESPTAAPVANNTPRPSKEDCQAIVAGDPVPEQDQLTQKRFTVSIEVFFDFVPGVSLLEEATDWIQENVLPALANCEIESAGQQQRTLRSHPRLDRNLKQTALAFVGDAKLEDVKPNGSCESDGNECRIVELVIDLFLRDNNLEVLDFHTLIRDTLTVQSAGLTFVERMDVKSVSEETSRLPTLAPNKVATPTPTTRSPVSQPTATKGPNNATPTPTTRAPVTQPTKSPNNATPTPTTRVPVTQPTESPMQGCDDILEGYFHSGDWFESDEDYYVDGTTFDVDCGEEELRVIFLDVGPALDDTCAEQKCVDVIPKELIEQACLAGGADSTMLLQLGTELGNRRIVFGYENGDVENPCTGETRSNVISVLDTVAPVTQPTKSPNNNPTPAAPVVQPTMQGCDILDDYFHNEEWLENDEVDQLESNVFDVGCGSEVLPVIFLDVGPTGDYTCSEQKCVDVLSEDVIDQACPAGDDLLYFAFASNLSNRRIVFGYENECVQNPCTGETRSNAKSILDESD